MIALIHEFAGLAPALAPRSDEAAAHAMIDGLEEATLRERPLVDLPLTHHFVPGLYVRRIFMPAGVVVTSRVHRTRHPFVILRGSVSVVIPGVGLERLEAPHFGFTEPGTRRALLIHEDCEWLTFHPLVEGEESEADLPKIEERIIEPRALPDGSSAYDRYRAGLAAQESLPVEEELRRLPAQVDYGGAP